MTKRHKGLFISFEGGEGSGKTTQIALLRAWFEGQGREVLLTREPGGTPAAEAVRELFVSGETDRWDGMSEALLVFAGRRHHVVNLIKPALERGAVVLCDRYVDSSMAYQGYGRQIGKDVIDWLAGHCIEDVMPDRTFLLDLPVKTGLARAGGRDGENAARFGARRCGYWLWPDSVAADLL